MIKKNEVVLVNENDEVIGTMEKLRAHKEGLLHRAFSVMIFNDAGEMLIHQRAINKYHCGGLWSNTCCSHPQLNETPIDGAKRRLMEEMGISCELKFVDTFIYKVKFDNGLTEHEFDHMFVGRCNDIPNPNPDEVSDWKYVSIEKLKKDIENNPEIFTFWFKEIVKDKLITLQKTLG